METLYSAYFNYKNVALVEGTKREAIAAWRDVKLSELTNQRELLEQFMKETFKERATVIEGFFEKLDEAIESGNDNLLEKSIMGILTIAKHSPLLQAKDLMDAMRNPDVKVIDL
ncbi:hypothetical protein C7389_1413 [Azoarcus indigens]|uniref:Uncharacterized protein n=2 Tax=Azoarcus indigens TaxID=29545 RepID=A0A4R6DGZ2_9RHOO|nr:hypothetical protein C7389_1413 [Azoarcus indigens]